MNREQKRMMAKQGADQSRPTKPRPTSATAPQREKTSPGQFMREVGEELRKVAWPTKREVINSTIVVLIAVVLMTLFIFAVDTGANRLVRFIYSSVS